MKRASQPETIILAINAHDRLQLATTIERLINLLDATAPDAESEPWLGWPEQGADRPAVLSRTGDDDREDENEHGGDICDEPHDQPDEGNDEPFLGWRETCSQRGVGVEGWAIVDDPEASPAEPVLTGRSCDQARMVRNRRKPTGTASLSVRAAEKPAPASQSAVVPELKARDFERLPWA